MGRLILALGLIILPAHAAPPGAHPRTPASPARSCDLSFGILPIGGPVESLAAWRPVLSDMAHAVGCAVDGFSVSTYTGIDEAVRSHRVDVAFLSGRLALDAVDHGGMHVVAQLARGDGSKGYTSVLIVRGDSPIHSLQDIMSQAGRWRFARGETMSVSGYLVPEAQLFARHGIDSETFFKTVRVDNHQNNALAVANGEVDIATNNSADLERFRANFPEQYARLRIIWRSTLIPHAVLVVRDALSEDISERIATFLTHYARSKGPGARAQRAKLQRIHDIAGFAPADNAMLIPFADIEYKLARRRAMNARWVNSQAQKARLRHLEAEHETLINHLQQ